MILKLPKEYLVLGGIIILLVLALVLVNVTKGCSQANVPNIPTVAKDAVTKIVFRTPAEGEITLAKDKNNKWRIEPQGFPADKAMIDSMLGNIADLDLKELISDKQVYERYDLDDAHKISVTGYAGDKVVRQMDVGKPSDTSSFTFVKLANDPNVYSAKSNIKLVFDKKIVDIRDKVVMNITRDEITEFVLEDGKVTMHIKKETKKAEGDGGGETTVWKADLSNAEVPENIINELFDGMTNLTCDLFMDDKSKAEFEKAPFHYRVTAKGTKDYMLTWVGKPENNQYPGISTESDYPFKIVGYKALKTARTIENGVLK